MSTHESLLEFLKFKLEFHWNKKLLFFKSILVSEVLSKNKIDASFYSGSLSSRNSLAAKTNETFIGRKQILFLEENILQFTVLSREGMNFICI